MSVGDTVTWTNNGEHPHTVTADTGAFASQRLDPGASFSFTFTTAGTFAYHCEFHSDMTGQVAVGAAAAPPADPQTAPAPAPAGEATDPAAGAPAGDAGTGAAPGGTAPSTAIIPEPLSPAVVLVLFGVGIFYTTLVVALDTASKRT